MAVNQIGQLAAEIYDTEFNYASNELERDREINQISGWLIANEGLLNTVIYTNFSGGNPGLLQEEANIFKYLYLSKYYKKKSRDVLRNVGTDVDWIRLSEGDTTIVRSNKNETAKTYAALARDNDEELKQLTYSYNLYQAAPRQTAGTDGGWPTTGSGANAWWPPNYYFYPYYASYRTRY